MSPWAWYEENAGLVHAIIRRAARGDARVEEAVRDDVLPRIPGLVARWRDDHPSGASLTSYVASQVRRYACKARAAEVTRARGESLDGQDVALDPGTSSRDARDEVQYLLERLGVQDRTVLVMRHMLGLSLSEMAWELDACKETVRKRLAVAERHAREVMGGG